MKYTYLVTITSPFSLSAKQTRRWDGREMPVWQHGRDSAKLVAKGEAIEVIVDNDHVEFRWKGIEPSLRTLKQTMDRWKLALNGNPRWDDYEVILPIILMDADKECSSCVDKDAVIVQLEDYEHKYKGLIQAMALHFPIEVLLDLRELSKEDIQRMRELAEETK